ncbi:Ribosomal RNA small subunit methyltransferase B [Corynebacterium kalinowskii]|uniref:Ribosomal RNA small subunit methyltransferase B n=1 Tax=Corynebacterium kalinowskii TaxID=2675216 RepID=A0A6B8VQG5_9CORY|nr:transcription antitermination factor NusB [Corynebacterium kalinowskii]QGU02091.1 Ribosomal RNA small subunit methyltransferase B [Corynebacterium kalinowskii]
MSLGQTGGFRARSQSGDKPPAAKQPNRGSSGQKPKQAAGNRRPRPNEGDHVQGIVAMGVDKARAVAFEVLLSVATKDAYANLVLPKTLRTHKLSGRDAAFATELTYGSLRTLGVLDAVINAVSSRPEDKVQSGVLAALRLGAYQVLYTRVEPHAAVDTTVRIVEGIGQEKAKGFANAVMRSITRKTPEQWFTELTPSGDLAAMAFRHAHPEWIARSFAKSLPADELEAALAEDSARPRVHLVARPGEITGEELALISGGEEGTYSPYAVYLEGGDPGAVEPVKEGLAAVQDEGSQIIARAVTVAPVEGADQGRWLDLCAGPGGKAALIGALARIDGARVDAVEIAPHRARLIENTVRDLPVKVHVADGRRPGLEGGYDRVLVDAPCSGLGALRRRPEARWRKKESDIAELSQLQFELLSSAVDLVRPGGVIVYSTCSPDIRETRNVVDRAIEELGVQELDAQQLTCGMESVGEEKSVQMWPHRHGTDAMFFAVLRRPTTDND